MRQSSILPYNTLVVRVDDHPLLNLHAFATTLPSPPQTTALLLEEAEAPLSSDDAVPKAVRALLRYGGFKPTGRSKVFIVIVR